MKTWTVSLSILLILASVAVLAAVDSPNASAVKRLDGTTISSQEIDATVTRLLSAAKIPGVGVAILNDGKVVFLKGYGVRDKEKNLPLTPDSVFTAASLTKAAFACLVMELVQDSVLTLDKPVYQYLPKPLPEYANYKDLAGDQRYKKITTRMLLDHTSGFPNWRWATVDKKLNINFEPGSRFAYSGEGIDLLQMVVETVANRSLTDLMHERIFVPFGMTRTSMVWEPRFESDFVNAYDETGRSLGPQRRKHPDAAGSMQTTIADYSRLLQAILHSEGLRKETRDLMLSPQIPIFSKHEFPSLSTETTDENKSIALSYGIGWGLYTTPYGKAFFKEGHDDGLRHYAVCFEKPGACLLIMTNGENGESIYKELLETLLKNTYTPIEWEQFTPYNSAQ
jgi:CubicO group peptidase (beta-lactamase class C family)